MRVLYLTTSGELGGAETSVLGMIDSLVADASKYEFALIAPSAGPLVEAVRQRGVYAQVIPYPPAIDKFGDGGLQGSGGGRLSKHLVWLHGLLTLLPLFLYLIRLRLAIRDLKPAIVHLHGFKSLFLGTWATPRNIQVIWHVHDFVSTRPIMRSLLRFSVHRCDMAIANSKSTERDFHATCGDDVRSTSIYYCVDLDRFNPKGERISFDRAVRKEALKVALIATMAHWKGHSVFLRAIAMLPQSVAVHAYVVGGPIYTTEHSQCGLEELHELAEALGITEQVTFTGYVRDTAPLIRGMDIVVHASTEPEPFGLVIAEGMACGRPVIVSEAGGAAEILHLGEAGLGFPPKNVTALASTIGELAADQSQRTMFGERGRQVAEKYFSPCRMRDDLIAIYGVVTSDRKALSARKRLTNKQDVYAREPTPLDL